jgi:hypothetical protein
MESGWRLAGNKEQGIVLERDGFKMCFDIRNETKKGVLWAGCMKRFTSEKMTLGLVTNTSLTVQVAHGRLGHMREDSTRKAAKALGWRLVPGTCPHARIAPLAKVGRRMSQRTLVAL